MRERALRIPLKILVAKQINPENQMTVNFLYSAFSNRIVCMLAINKIKKYTLQ